MNNSEYIGKELEVFKDATNWKSYWLKSVEQYISGSVLEVGAGLGINSKFIVDNCQNLQSLTTIEPDKLLADQIIDTIGNTTKKVNSITGYLKDLNKDEKYDTIMYIDVIEHIENDADELALAKMYLKEGGYLIILVPAHNFLFSPFDKAIGHYRRYNKNMLNQSIGNGLTKQNVFYLDSMGLMASLVNKYFLKQDYPTKNQIDKWDKMIVPFSKVIDKIIFHSIGKSLIGIWKK